MKFAVLCARNVFFLLSHLDLQLKPQKKVFLLHKIYQLLNLLTTPINHQDLVASTQHSATTVIWIRRGKPTMGVSAPPSQEGRVNLGPVVVRQAFDLSGAIYFWKKEIIKYDHLSIFICLVLSELSLLNLFIHHKFLESISTLRHNISCPH